jgi:hypothetical protein
LSGSVSQHLTATRVDSVPLNLVTLISTENASPVRKGNQDANLLPLIPLGLAETRKLSSVPSNSIVAGQKLGMASYLRLGRGLFKSGLLSGKLEPPGGRDGDYG